MKRFFFYFALIISFFSSNLYSAGKTRIAILDLEAKNVPRATASAVTDMITTEIVNTGAFEVVERNQMDGILKEQGFQQSGCTDQSCAVKIGKLISARKILIGSVSKLDRALIINIRMVDIEKGVAELAAMEKAESESTADEAAKKIVRKIFEKTVAGPEPREKTPTPEKEQPIETFSTSGYYTRGIVPGWGQIYAGSRTKGYIFMAGFVVAGAAAIYGVLDFNTKESDYMDLPRGTSQSEFDKKNDAKKSAGLFAFSMLSITGLIYAANWADLIFFNSAPAAAASLRESGAGDICFNAGANVTAPYISERQYSVSIGMKF